MKKTLDGIRVLDLTRILAGPWATQLLGDYGADVIKIERPGQGDDSRHWGPPWLEGESAYFLSANRNKRSVTVDISTTRGQQLIRELACEADVVLENFRVGTLSRYGLERGDLLEMNPKLVICSISVYGRTGPKASDPGYDAMIQASAGLMSITGAPDAAGGGPQKVGVAVADIMAGMYAATAVLAALHERERSGRGQLIDVPLYDSQVAWLANQAMNFLVGGTVPGRMGTAHPNLVPYQAFQTSDGSLMLAVGNDRQFASCMACIGREELGTDDAFATNNARVENRERLVDAIQQKLLERTTAQWLHAFEAHEVPAGPINDIGEVLGSQYASDRGLVTRIDNSAGESVPVVSNPVTFSATPVSYDRAPPLLGEHTEEVLREWLGYSAEVINELREKSAI